MKSTPLISGQFLSHLLQTDLPSERPKVKGQRSGSGPQLLYQTSCCSCYHFTFHQTRLLLLLLHLLLLLTAGTDPHHSISGCRSSEQAAAGGRSPAAGNYSRDARRTANAVSFFFNPGENLTLKYCCRFFVFFVARCLMTHGVGSLELIVVKFGLFVAVLS